MAQPKSPFGSRPDRQSGRDPFVPGPPPLSPKRDSRGPFGAPPDDRPGSDPFAGYSVRKPRGGWLPPVDRRVKLTALGGAILIASIVGLSFLPSGEGSQNSETETAGGSGPAPSADPTVPATSVPPTVVPPTPSPPTTPTQTPPTPTAPPSTNTPVPTPAPDEEPGGDLRGCDSLSDDDPHYLINFDQSSDRLYSCGEDTWQVFVCTAQNSDQVDRVKYVDEVLGETAAWFDWASGGQYDIDFSIGDGTIWAAGNDANYINCLTSAWDLGWGETRTGAVMLLDDSVLDHQDNTIGVGTCGIEATEADKQFANTLRLIAIAVHASGSREGVAVHELGHAHCWPHSYSGETSSEYDNPADVMSYAHNWPVGTVAVNRYAAGWIHPGQVRVHRDSVMSYTLSPCCTSGVQLLALLPPNSSAISGGYYKRWWSIEVRDPTDEWEQGLADVGVGSEPGVLVHWIDQSGGPDSTGSDRRQAQVGGRAETSGSEPLVFPTLFGPGAKLCLDESDPTDFVSCSGAHDWRLDVAASQSGELTVTVAPGLR